MAKRKYSTSFGSSKRARKSVYIPKRAQRRSARRTTSVRKIQRSGARKPTAAKNRASVYALAKQVKSLQRAQVGPIQSNYLWIGVNTSATGNPPVTVHTPKFVNSASMVPFVMLLNDMRETAFFLQSSWNSTTHAPQSSLMHTFQRVPDPTPAGEFEGDQQNYSYHFRTLDDTVSMARYKPMYAKVDFHFSWPNALPQDPVLWVRLDIIKPKNVLQSTAAHSIDFPGAAYSLGNLMITDANQPRNYIDKNFFDVIDTKFVKFHNADVDLGGVGRTLQRKCTMSYRFPPNLVHDLSATNKVNVHGPAKVEQNPISNIPIDQQVYLIWQTNYPPSDMKKLGCQIYRRNTWRDDDPA